VDIYSGVLFLHALPRASAIELEAVLKRLAIKRKTHRWEMQPLVLGCVKTEIEWTCSNDMAETLVSELCQIEAIRFELTSAQTADSIGQRWAYTPGLGLFHCPVDEIGNLLVNENQIRRVLYGTGNNVLKTQHALRKLLGTAWDDELERFREQKYQAVANSLLAGLG
jgi:hypothetical protein